ncbi:MAG: hypothetical protein HKN58_05010, partial [Xanthomonadales bacterium]|nr:hypothetical protein [Xanthomonadales bacterium]
EQASTWTGFAELGAGTRLSSDPLLDERVTLAEFRGRLEAQWQPGRYTVRFKLDGGYDGVESEAYADLRDLTLSFRAGDNLDVSAGRQVLTWGTGDLVFLNDLFPKDFVSFFAGRDDEFLKAPANALRLNYYADWANVDFAWTPVFEPDNYLTGERFAFFSPLAGTRVAPDPPLNADEPDDSLADGEFALRLHRTVEGHEYALYLYRGFFKQPNALTPALEPTFAALSAYGASLRRPAGPGLLNVEVAWYDSRDDGAGDNPLLPNSQLRVLVGYEWEARPRLTVGLQYYLERTLDHDRLIANSPAPQFEPEENRHLLTNRLTLRSQRDRYTWSLFSFYSPSDGDFYLRPVLGYRHSDQWSLTGGANWYGGRDDHTFFNQLEDASNVYVRLRFNY